MKLLLGILIIILILTTFDTFNTQSPSLTYPEEYVMEPNFYKKMKVIVINLAETTEGKRRYEKMKKLKNTIYQNAQMFSGVYGKKYNFTNELKTGVIKKKWNIGKWKGMNDKFVDMDLGEIGVALSHYNVWKMISKSNKNTIVLEDDAVKLHPDFDKLTSYFMLQLPDDWDFFLLGFWLHRGDDGSSVNKYISKVKNFVLMHAIIVSPRGAKKALELLPIDMPIDSWLSKKSNKLNIYRHNLYNTKYHSKLIQQNRLDKQIQNTNNW